MATASSHFAASVEVHTVLPLDEVLKLARSIAGTKPKGLKSGPGRIELSGESDKTVSFLIKSPRNALWMEFVVIGDEERGSTRAKSLIRRYGTTQEKFLGLIPVAPKQMMGYFLYKHFMESFRTAALAEDPDADVWINERGGHDSDLSLSSTQRMPAPPVVKDAPMLASPRDPSFPRLRRCHDCGAEFTPILLSDSCPDCGGTLDPSV